jgi:hypothetical protein
MCEGCWTEYGRPNIRNERTEAAAALVSLLYEIAPAGGRAHIVTDDWNIETEHIAWCIEESPRDEDAERDRRAGDVLAAFLAMSMDERAATLAIHERLI